MIVRDGSFAVDRPSSLHVWDDQAQAWVLDPKLAHNAPIDAQIVEIETRNPITHRSQRETALLDPPLFDGLNAYFQAVEAAIRAAGAALSNSALAGFTLPPLPDLKTNKGMENVKAIDDQIVALRAQRLT